MGKFKPNSYFFFMQEQRRVKPAWKDKSNQELMVLCDSLWQSLSPQEKVRFETMKKDYVSNDPEAKEKERRKGDVRVAGGFDSLGRPLVDIKKRDRERKEEAENKIEAVSSMVEMAVKGGRLEKTEFYVIQTNVFVKTEEDPPIFVPAEITIAKFSLQEGVIEVYQAFTVPGKIPLGYKRLCLENSQEGHKIPLEIDTIEDVHEFKQTQDVKILQDISDFLSGTELLFCMPEKIAQCEGVLRTIAHRSNLSSPAIVILSLPELLVRLANKSQEGITLPSANVAELELERERFLYQAGLSCPWHENLTDTNTCSSATVWRWCFTVLDLCCQHYKIPLVSGRHIPKAVETEPCGQGWSMVGQGSSGLNNTSRQNRNIVRRPGGFASEDVRFREEKVVEEEDQQDDRQAKIQGSGGKKTNIVHGDQEKMKQSMEQTGTISDYMGNMSMTSDVSSESEFVTLDSISLASTTHAQVRVQPAVVVRKGVGRGSVLPGRRASRMAAVFSGAGYGQ